MNKKGVVLIAIITVGLVYLAVYLGRYYHRDKSVDEYLKSKDNVEVKKVLDGYYFDGPGTENTVVFFPGAKVEYLSYAPLMYKLASKGIDAYLLEMPYNIAYFGKNKASNVIYNNESNWYLMGHSLGGVVASGYAVDNQDKVSGIILLASYPNKKIPDNIRLLSIYGTNDGVLNMDKLKKNEKFFPTDCKKIEIDGGNHANFGNYGDQKKDKKSTISRDEQQNKTVEEIVKFINKKS